VISDSGDANDPAEISMSHLFDIMAGRKGNSASQVLPLFFFLDHQHCYLPSLPHIETFYPGGKEHNAKKNAIHPDVSFKESNNNNTNGFEKNNTCDNSCTNSFVSILVSVWSNHTFINKVYMQSYSQ